MVYKITIAGVDRSATVRPETLSIELPVSRRGGMARLTVFDQTLTPSLINPLDTVTITDWDGTTALFSGVVVNPGARIAEAGMNEYDLECMDGSYYLEAPATLVNKKYVNQAADSIVKDIISTYIATITTNNVKATPVIPYVVFSYKTVGEALRKLAKLAAQSSPIAWWLDASYDLHWTQMTQLATAPISLSDVAADIAAGAIAYESRSFKYGKDARQIQNSVIVRGGSLLSVLQTENFTGDGVKKIFSLAFMPSAQQGAVAPTVTVGGVAKTVAFDNGLTPTTQYVITVGALGTVTQSAVGTAALVTGTDPTPGNGVAIVVTYVFDVPIILQMSSAASIKQYNVAASKTAGKHQAHIFDQTIKSYDAARARAQAHLQNNAFHIPTVDLTIPEQYTGVGILPGQVISVRCAQLGLAATNFAVIGYRAKGSTTNAGRKIELRLESI